MPGRNLHIIETDKLLMISIVIEDSFISYYPGISFRIGMQMIIACKIIISHYLTRILRKTIDSQMGSNPQTTAVCLLDRMNDIVAQRLWFRKVRTKGFHTFAIVTIDAIVSAKPHQACFILIETKHSTIGKPLLIIYFTEKISVFT